MNSKVEELLNIAAKRASEHHRIDWLISAVRELNSNPIGSPMDKTDVMGELLCILSKAVDGHRCELGLVRSSKPITMDNQSVTTFYEAAIWMEDGKRWNWFDADAAKCVERLIAHWRKHNQSTEKPTPDKLTPCPFCGKELESEC